MSYPVMSTSVPWSLVKSGFHKAPTFEDASLVQKAVTGHRSALSLKPYATWNFEVDLNYVLGGEYVQSSVLQMFLGCFLATCGGAGFFYFTDPNDSAVQYPDGTNSSDQSLMIAAPSGPGSLLATQTTGDGSTTSFQLARQIDQGVDILQQVSNVVLFVNGVPMVLSAPGIPARPMPMSLSFPSTDADMSWGVRRSTVTASINKGVVTFSTPPPANAVLTWQGSFQYLCQFSDDTLKDLARVSKNSSGFLWSCGAIAFESVVV